MLALLLDKHISPIVAEQTVAKDPSVSIVSIHRWQEGECVSTDDTILLEAAYREQVTLVTFDQSTIRPILKEWGEQGRAHGGVIFIDENFIAQNDYGGWVKALRQLWNRMKDTDFTNGVLFFQLGRHR